jgi:hypothetical protein
MQAADGAQPLGFVVPLCVATAEHARVADNCLRSIGRFYPGACVVVVEDGASVKDVSAPMRAHASTWLGNPFPGSGEFGALFVAAHFQVFTGVKPQRVMMLHDSTVLQRKLTAEELARTERQVWPLWNTQRLYMDIDSASALVSDDIAPFVSAEKREQWLRALGAPDVTVTFGCMVVGPPDALRATWDMGMIHAARHITSRAQRCRVERLISLAMVAASTCPRGTSTTDVMPALCGCIFSHPRHFVHGAPVTPWDAPERTPDQPFIVKHWLGR